MIFMLLNCLPGPQLRLEGRQRELDRLYGLFEVADGLEHPHGPLHRHLALALVTGGLIVVVVIILVLGGLRVRGRLV